MKKILFILLIGLFIIFMITGCDTVIPGEGEGEGEGEPEPVQMTVLVESYIAVGCSRCKKVEPFLDQLAEEYSREEVILVNLVPWGDTYEIREAYRRYEWYNLEGGIPQITFNGLNNNLVPGETANYSTIKNRIEDQLAISPTIQLEVSKTSNSSGTEITGKIKNIGNSSLTNLVVNGMVFQDRGTGFHYTVTDIFEDEKVEINSLAPGEEKNFTLTITGLVWIGSSDLDGVIFVQSVSHPKKIIYQSVFID